MVWGVPVRVGYTVVVLSMVDVTTTTIRRCIGRVFLIIGLEMVAACKALVPKRKIKTSEKQHK